jgi:hypothetical protein
MDDAGTIAYNTSVATLELPFNYFDGHVTLQMLKSYANVGELIAWVQPPGTNGSVTDCSDVAGLAEIDDVKTPNVLAVWRGGNYWPSRFSFATDVVIVTSLPVQTALGPTGNVSDAGVACTDLEGGCRATLFICPLLSQQTGSAKLKLYELRVT